MKMSKSCLFVVFWEVGASWEDQNKTNFQPLTYIPQTKKWSRRVQNSSPASRATDANTTDEPRVRVMRTRLKFDTFSPASFG